MEAKREDVEILAPQLEVLRARLLIIYGRQVIDYILLQLADERACQVSEEFLLYLFRELKVILKERDAFCEVIKCPLPLQTDDFGGIILNVKQHLLLDCLILCFLHLFCLNNSRRSKSSP